MDEGMTEHVLLQFDEPGTGRAVRLEDDGRVAYAYMLMDGRIVGDVWLYNVAPTPDVVNWKDRSQLPFLNPRAFCRHESASRLSEESKVNCRWDGATVEIWVDDVPWAKLEPGAKPGWSRLALRSGPLAKPLESAE